MKVVVLPASTCSALRTTSASCDGKAAILTSTSCFAATHRWSSWRTTWIADCPWMWEIVDSISVKTTTSQHKKLHLQPAGGFELCRVSATPSLRAAQSLSDCCSCFFGGPPRSAARMTQNRSCWRGNVWWCATPPLPRNHRATLWVCPWGRVPAGWRFLPSVTPTLNPQRWATVPWPSTSTRWVPVWPFTVEECRFPSDPKGALFACVSRSWWTLAVILIRQPASSWLLEKECTVSASTLSKFTTGRQSKWACLPSGTVIFTDVKRSLTFSLDYAPTKNKIKKIKQTVICKSRTSILFYSTILFYSPVSLR